MEYSLFWERVCYAMPNRKPLLQQLRNALLGPPLNTTQTDFALVPVLLAIPLLCNDAISSVAYATQQILLALGGAGLWVLQQKSIYDGYNMGISLAIILLLLAVVISYCQTVYAYPSGGGSFIVAKENLGVTPGLVAAAALLVDYILTVAVSIASGVQNLEDVPFLEPLHIRHHLVFYCIFFAILLTIINLRGVKESGKIFAVPTYTFIGLIYVMIVCGLVGPYFGWQIQDQYLTHGWPVDHPAPIAAGTVGLALLLRTFANGCSAMTGTEAVSNGVPIFQEPKSKNAAITLILMGLILGTSFLGVAALSANLHVVYWEFNGQTSPAVIDQLSGAVFGKTGLGSVAYLLMQFSTAIILIIAANTSFAGFPRLASILASNGYLPRQLQALGDRLVFSNGILVLGVLSIYFLILKKGNVDALIPLFMIGVFISFTLSQLGMVKHWFKHKGAGWQRKAMINGIGGLFTGLVFFDVLFEKFMEGAWIVVLIIIFLLFLFAAIHKHFVFLAQRLCLDQYKPPAQPQQNVILMLVHSLDAATMQALDYARSLGGECIALHINVVPEKAEELKTLWQVKLPDVRLVMLNSPYRSLVKPVIKYVSALKAERPNVRITVIIGEFVSDKWWHTFLHGNSGLLLKLALLNRPDIVVANVRYSVKA
jgi:amino acid transporter